MSEDKDELTDLTTGSPEEENDAHSNYQPETSPHDSITHHLSGMYQNWFLDYASYVILERAVPHINDCALYTSPSPRDRTRARMPSSA